MQFNAPTSAGAPQSSSTKSAASPATEAPEQNERTELLKKLRAEADACRSKRRLLIKNWSISTDYLRGKPFSSQTDEDRIAVPVDFTLTKQKKSNIFSQIPRIFINHPPQTASKEFDGWLFRFEQKVNDVVRAGGIEATLNESLTDMIAMSGIGIALVSHETLTELVDIPAIDMNMLPPQVAMMIMQTGTMPDGSPVPMEQMPRVTDRRYKVRRLSPKNFLWDLSFEGSDFNECPWIGFDGQMPWAEAKRRWNLPDEDRSKYAGGLDRAVSERINQDIDIHSQTSNKDLVSFTELFVKASVFESEGITKFDTIKHIVFLGNSTKPVQDEIWKGQDFTEDGELIGSLKYPIQVVSLSYVPDEPIPQAESAIARGQTDELNKSRSQQIQQRDYNRPIRWVDTNRTDATYVEQLLRGEWQAVIPVMGTGTNIIGEVPRSPMPPENFSFDKIVKSDLQDIYNLVQGNVAGIETKAEANNIYSAAQTSIAAERAQVGKFICNIAEVVAGLLCIAEDPSQFGEGFDPQVCRMLNFSILADSTVLLDSNQRKRRIEDFLDFAAKTGWVNIEPVLREYAQLSSMDPSAVIRPPDGRAPVEPNISLRLTGTEDLLQPLTLAFLMKSGQAPDAKLIEEAKSLISVAVNPPQGAQAPPPGFPGMPGPLGPPGLAGALGGPAGPPEGPMPDPNLLPPPPGLPPLDIGDAMPGYTKLPHLDKRKLER